MGKVQVWLKAFRLRTLPLSISGILMGSAVAHLNGFWDTRIFVLSIITTVLFQIISNLANDLGDGMKGTDNANRIGPERSIQSGEIGVPQMKTAIALFIFMSLISSGFLIYYGTMDMPKTMILTYIVLAIACIVAAITYTIGKKAYGYSGLGDLMVLIFFGFVSVLGVYSLYAKEFEIENILPATFVGLLSVAVLNLNNMRDFKNDFEVGKMTMVVKIGPNQAKLYHAMNILIALVSLAVYISRTDMPSLYLSMIPGLYLIYHLRLIMQVTDPKKFDPELKKVALTTFAMSILFFLLVVTR